MDPPVRNEVLRFLWMQHLPKMKMPIHSQHANHEDIAPVLDRDFGDFVIANHLVPEQMIIYPLSSLHQKSQLIFRYPSHKKKLLQYINSKSARMSSNKLKRVHYHPLLKEFIDNYLKTMKENSKDLFIFKKKHPLQKPDDFIKSLDDFLTKNPHSYNYPYEYI